MRIRQLTVQNFRGIKNGTVDFAGDTLLVGGNNAGKSTICEAIDLVLGPERLYRKPVVNEHDFYLGRYLGEDGKPIEIRVEALLIDLSAEAERRFHSHIRRWNDKLAKFADEGGAAEGGDAAGACWALPVVFIGRYDSGEDDFIGSTFLAHPSGNIAEGDEEPEVKLGGGLKFFTRDHKRLCGFLFLRALRTGSRALTLQRGSLLDTILRIGGPGLDKLWQDTLKRLHDLDPPIGDIDQLKRIRNEVESRMRQFVQLASSGDATAFFASELTREHLREVIRLFVASEQNNYLVPFQRQGTGAINMLVFALLTFIAELKQKQSVIFALEEPEIALPPHTQRRVVRYVLREMGQTIVTSHSPDVIVQFEPEQIVMVNRAADGALSGKPIDTQGIKIKTFKTERKQFAEAVLASAVLVVEGSTEAALFQEASTVLEQARGSAAYTHFDLAGVTVFNAGGGGSVPRFGPIFKALGKVTFGFYDKPNAALTAEATASLNAYAKHWESPHKGIEDLLAAETSADALRRFLEVVKDRSDYPSHHPKPTAALNEAEIRELARKVLKDRKGEAYGYGAILVGECKVEADLPITMRSVLDAIQKVLSPMTLAAPAAAAAPNAAGAGN